MPKHPWKPWHEVVKLRDDLKSGELSLSLFAADLYDVAMERGADVYRIPAQFFALTYPTFNLRELAKDVVLRLAGKNDKAVRQLELTYGGGKTHALITLYHLVRKPGALPDLPAVREFLEHIGTKPPRARIAVLAFDKLDVEKGMEVPGPDGSKRWLRNPWSVLAFQIAGADGLRLLNAEGKDAERDSAPAENLLVDLLQRPAHEGLAVLILIDEVLMFAREKVSYDPAWRHKLVDFFQYLTQAATKVRSCAIVASLLATDPRKSDTLGKELAQELYAVFRREREEGVQPVVKEDVAEILRRRFFKPESIKDRESFRPHVVAALKGIAELDEQTRKDGKMAEDRFLASYPFHPELTEVLYSKWTNLEGFQRTRGVLRTFALALRDAEKWDENPLVASNVFLRPPGEGGVSEAARELTTVAATEEYEGKKQEWTAILDSELTKARETQQEFPGLRFREIEQAVFATFLHSQPIGQKALTRDLLMLLGQSRPDRIDLEKALRRWTEVSWFLDETAMAEGQAEPTGPKPLPQSWRLGSKPNLRQMHFDACARVSLELIETKLVDEISRLKSLTQYASTAGASVHNLPDRASDIKDDGEFRFAVLGPRAASEVGKPSAEAKRFLDETTAPDRPRVYRNAVVLVVPSREGLDVARNRVREYLGWEEVRSQLEGKGIDALRRETLLAYLENAKKRSPEAIRQAYSIVVTVSEKNEVQAFRIAVTDEPLFALIKADPRARIQETAVRADALLPGGPYNLWREGETSRPAKDLVGAFGQFPHLPKMLRRKEILDTLMLGAKEGFFALRIMRPDRSVKTFWRQEPAETELNDPSLEVVLPGAATLTTLSPNLLAPGILPDLWKGSEIMVKNVLDYFSGGRSVAEKKDGYEETIIVPKAEKAVVEDAIRQCVKEGVLWLTSGPASLCSEELPEGLLTPDAVLQAPPAPISAPEILPQSLPDGWSGETTTALAIAVALSRKAGKNLPWSSTRGSIATAVRTRMVELTVDSGPWPCEYPGAGAVRLHQVKGPIPPPPPGAGVLVAEAEVRPNEIQDLAERVPEIVKATAGLRLVFRIHVELSDKSKLPKDVVDRVNQILKAVKEALELH